MHRPLQDIRSLSPNFCCPKVFGSVPNVPLDYFFQLFSFGTPLIVSLCHDKRFRLFLIFSYDSFSSGNRLLVLTRFQSKLGLDIPEKCSSPKRNFENQNLVISEPPFQFIFNKNASIVVFSVRQNTWHCHPEEWHNSNRIYITDGRRIQIRKKSAPKCNVSNLAKEITQTLTSKRHCF